MESVVFAQGTLYSNLNFSSQTLMNVPHEMEVAVSLVSTSLEHSNADVEQVSHSRPTEEHAQVNKLMIAM